MLSEPTKIATNFERVCLVFAAMYLRIVLSCDFTNTIVPICIYLSDPTVMRNKETIYYAKETTSLENYRFICNMSILAG